MTNQQRSVWTALLLALPPCAAEELAPNYILGTQSIGARYQFSEATKLVESARQVRALGSNLMKFTLSASGSFGPPGGNVPERPGEIRTLVDLVRLEPSHREVLGMPFVHYLLWVYPLSSRTHAADFAEADQETEYREIYDFTVHLLRTFRRTGKQFYLGHWEGDWHLRSGYDPKQGIPQGTATRFARWLQVRQKAVDDAKRDVPPDGMGVWHYTEVNLVLPFLDGGSCLTNDILPLVDVDFVSYSAYDALGGNIEKDLPLALNHIESKMRPRPGVPGKRVWIGEYGFPSAHFTPTEQNTKSLEVMRAGVAWGCHFVLYWQLYCNEQREGQPMGFWMIDDQNVRQPVWTTHERYFRWAAKRIAEVGPEEFRLEAVDYLRDDRNFLAPNEAR